MRMLAAARPCIIDTPNESTYEIVAKDGYEGERAEIFTAHRTKTVEIKIVFMHNDVATR